MKLAVIAFVAALFVFWSHSAPGLTFEDSGELAAAAACFGVPHPPGFPLLTMLGGALIKLLAPFGIEAARAMVLLSVLSAALAVALVVRLVAGAQSDRPVSGLISGAALILAPTFAASAVVAETYALAAALAAALMLAATAATARPRTTGLLFGLTIAAHPAGVFLFPLAVFGALRQNPGIQEERRASWPRAAAGTLVGLSAYLFVPLAAARGPALNWGGINSAGSLIDHLLRRQFGAAPERDLVAQASFLTEHLIGQWPLLIAAALIFGLTKKSSASSLRKIQLPLVAITLFVTTAGLFWAQHWPVTELITRVRIAGSFAPLVLLSAALVGLLLCPVEAALMARFQKRYRLPALIAGMLLCGFHVAPSYGSDSHTPTLAAFTDMSGVTEAEDYARAVLAAAPAGSIVIVNRLGYSDVLYFPLVYGQIALGLGQDVLVIDRELLGAEWYRAELTKRRADLIDPIRRLAESYATLSPNAGPRERRIANVPFLRELSAAPGGAAFIGKPSKRITEGLRLSPTANFWWLGKEPRVALSAQPWPFLKRTPNAYSDPWRQELVRMARARE